jgi:hypothetical protein
MSYIALEYLCPAGHRSASLEPRADPRQTRDCDCGATASRTISAPRVKIPIATAATRGKSDERPPGVPDTSLLAEGMPYREWREKHTPPQERDEDLQRATRRVRDLPESKL